MGCGGAGGFVRRQCRRAWFHRAVEFFFGRMRTRAERTESRQRQRRGDQDLEITDHGLISFVSRPGLYPGEEGQSIGTRRVPLKVLRSKAGERCGIYLQSPIGGRHVRRSTGASELYF